MEKHFNVHLQLICRLKQNVKKVEYFFPLSVYLDSKNKNRTNENLSRHCKQK